LFPDQFKDHRVSAQAGPTGELEKEKESTYRWDLFHNSVLQQGSRPVAATPRQAAFKRDVVSC
jgi:hypothetical protein